MTPFQEFRLWTRRAPANERLSAAVATAVVLGLLIWVIVPISSGPTSSNAAFTPGQGQMSVGGSTGQATASTGTLPNTASGAAAAPGPGGGPLPGTSAGPAGASTGVGRTTTANGPKGCTSPPASGVGITASHIKIAVLLVDLSAGGAGNSTFNIAPVGLQKSSYQAVIDDVNASGGVACRTLVPQYFTANPIDQNDLHQKCLDVAQSGAFAVLDPGAYAQSTQMTCYATHHILYFGAYLIEQSLVQQFSPYLFEFSLFDRVYHDTVFALKSRGFFSPSNGFKKLGLLYRTCFPDLVSKELAWLHQAGLSSSQIDTYDVGCPQQPFASPADLEQAAFKFHQDGVTHITDVFFLADFANFTNVAQQQGYHFTYGLPDDQLVTTSYSTHPNAQQINGAVAVAGNRDAEEKTPGMTPSATTRRCDAILAKHGIAPTYQQPYAVGNACDQVWMFAAAADHAPAVQANALAVGLQRARSTAFSFPQGPNDFSGGGTTAGQYYRFVTFVAACNCWRVLDPTFHRSTY